MHLGQEDRPGEPGPAPGAIPPPPPANLPPPPPATPAPTPPPARGWPSTPPSPPVAATPWSPYDAPPAALGPPSRWAALVLAAVAVLVVAGVGAVLFAATRAPGRAAAAPPSPVALTVGHPQATRGRPPETRDRTADGTVVDRGIADRVLHDYWPVHEQALVARDLPTLARLSAGPEQDWQEPAVACGCLHVDSPEPLLGASYYVPRQRSYPAWFLADAVTSYQGQPFHPLIVFTKARPGAPWLASYESGFLPGSGSDLRGPANDSAGYDVAPPAALHRRATRVAADFAALWQRAKDTGGFPSDPGFLVSGQTEARLNYLASYRQDQVQANGLIGHFRFFVSPHDRLYEVGVDGGEDLACQPVREVVHYTPTAGQVIAQDAQRTNWGPGLAPGPYREVTSTDTWQTCFVLSADPNVPVQVMNHDIGGAFAVGVPATQP